jgi:hypothetical protein
MVTSGKYRVRMGCGESLSSRWWRPSAAAGGRAAPGRGGKAPQEAGPESVSKLRGDGSE